MLDILPAHRQTPYYIFLDEVGRGCLAGPVVVGGCLWRGKFQQGQVIPSWGYLRELGVTDSKKVSEKKRLPILNSLGVNPLRADFEYFRVMEDDFYLHYLQAEVEKIEKDNILASILDLMKQVVIDLSLKAKLSTEEVTVIVDGRDKIPLLSLEDIKYWQLSVVKSDLLFAPTGLASLYAKVYRDHQMLIWDRIYPHFGLAKHKGYGTEKHLENLKTFGPSPIHRRTFAGVKEYFC